MAEAGRSTPATVRGVTIAVVLQVLPLLALLGALACVALVWWGASGDPVPAQMSGRLTAVAAFGLVGSFVAHELAHLAVLRRTPSVDDVLLERTGWRISLHPRGHMNPRRIALVAVAGPAACATVGLGSGRSPPVPRSAGGTSPTPSPSCPRWVTDGPSSPPFARRGVPNPRPLVVPDRPLVAPPRPTSAGPARFTAARSL